MADQQYPNFEITSAGLAALHQELGRQMHLNFEQQNARVMLAEREAEAMRLLTTLKDGHEPGKCQPVAVSCCPHSTSSVSGRDAT